MSQQSDLMNATRTRRIVLIAKILLAVFLALVVTEALLRIYGFDRPVLYERDPNAGFRIKPDQHIEMLTGTVNINEWGLRDARSFEAGETAATRVLVLGDSVTWGGLRIAQDAIFPSILEKRLGGNAVVLNGGVNGSSIVQMAARYEAHWAGLDPDIVVVYAIPATFERPPLVVLTESSAAFPMTDPKWALPVAVELARHSLASLPGLQWLRPPITAKAVSDDPPAENRRAALIVLNRLNQHGRFRLHVVLAPTAMDDTELRSTLRSELSALDIPFTDMAQAIPPTGVYFSDSAHYTPEGHAAVAEALSKILEPMLRTESK